MIEINNRISHPIPPIYNEKSNILVLGTFPSVKSREGKFFYHHPQNRFWKVISVLYQEELPTSIKDKREMLLRNNIAVWDVIRSCEISGSSDSSIKNVVPNDLSPILTKADIKFIYANGGTADRLYSKYIYPATKKEIVRLPSTSPANAAYSLEKLVEEWSSLKKTN